MFFAIEFHKKLIFCHKIIDFMIEIWLGPLQGVFKRSLIKVLSDYLTFIVANGSSNTLNMADTCQGE